MNVPIFNHHDYQPEKSSAPTPQNVVSGHQTHGPDQNVDVIGRPIHFIGGQFAGQTVRAELHEVQKADLGRKYARVDRRPLDPPPVVLLRLFYVYNAGTERQSEKEVRNYDEVQNLGLVCTVDLFRVPCSDSTHKAKDGGSRARKHSSASSNQTPYSSSRPSRYSPESHQQSFTFVPAIPYSTTSAQQSTIDVTHHQVPHQQPVSGYLGSSGSATDVVLHILGDCPVLESSKVTQALVGATFVQPANVDYQGKKSLMFVFADLAVKVEGTFILRYRVFDIFSKAYGIPDLVVQAECYGGKFRVYSTKEFPGLQASTELTKQLARWGVRLNIRETERKRRKKGERRSGSPTSTERGKGKGDADREHGNDGTDDD